MVVLAVTFAGFTSLEFKTTNEDLPPPTLEFHAETAKSKNIDDVINKLAPEGWIPAFIIEDELRKRILFQRSINPDHHVKTLEYQAKTIGGMMKDMQDLVNTEAADGWYPVFVVREIIKQRIIFARDTARPNAATEYMKLIVNQSRHIDDAFNHHGSMGWEPKFVIKFAERYHVLFRRFKELENKPRKYRAIKTFGQTLIDNTYDDLAESGWRPIMTFQDGDDYRMLFATHENAHRLEYTDHLVFRTKHIDDTFRRRNQNGWRPIFIFEFEDDKAVFSEKQQYRLLFARAKQ